MKCINKFFNTLFVLSLFMSVSLISNAQVKENKKDILEPFPKAAEGMVRHVIELEEQSDESNYQVEIIPGKSMSVDCNNHILMGSLDEKDLESWGYAYYEFNSDGQTLSTRMGCMEPNKVKFITGKTMNVRYNSNLPIVVYAPEGFEIKYRIWTAGENEDSVIK